MTTDRPGDDTDRDPVRWSSVAGEELGSSLFRAARAEDPPRPVAFAAMMPGLCRRQQRSLAVWKLAAAAAALIAAAGGASAAGALVRLRTVENEIVKLRAAGTASRACPAPAVTPAPPLPAASIATTPGPVCPALPRCPAVPSRTTAVMAPPALPPAVAPEEPTLAAPAEEPPPAAGDGTTESALIASALRALRVDRDPSRCLTLLDQHAREFVAGSLQQEAKLARVEALMALARRSEALKVVETIPASRQSLDLRTLQGELRATHGGCGEALRDFDAVVLRATDDDLVQRALWGRASCRARRGEDKEARRDLQILLDRYPEGRFAGQVRAALGVP